MSLVRPAVDACLRVTAYRWRVALDSELVREWRGELHALREEPGVPGGWRAYRQLRFALSLALSRPATPPQPWLAPLWRLLKPVLVLLGVPIAGVALANAFNGTAEMSLLLWPVRNSTAVGTAPLHVAGLLVSGLAAFALARWASRSARLPDLKRGPVHAVVVPTLLAVGVVLAYDRPDGSRTDRRHDPMTVAAGVVAWAVAIAVLRILAHRARVRGGRGSLASGLLGAGGLLGGGGLVAGAAAYAIASRGSFTVDALAAAMIGATAFAVRYQPPQIGSALDPTGAGPGTGLRLGRPTTSPMATTSPSEPTAAAAPDDPIGSAQRGIARCAGTGAGLGGLAVLAAMLTPGAGAVADSWTDWLAAVRQAAALVALLGAILATGTPRHRRAVAVAIVAGYCMPGLFVPAKWNVITEEAAPAALVSATAVLAGLLAALAAAGAVAGRHPAMRTRAAAGLIAGLALGAAALGAKSGGDADDDLVAIFAGLLGQVSGLLVVLVVWRVVRGRPPERIGRSEPASPSSRRRRVLLWTAVVVAFVVTGATQMLDGVAKFASRLLFAVAGPDTTEAPNVLGLFVVGLVIAAIASPALTARASTDPSHPPS